MIEYIIKLKRKTKNILQDPWVWKMAWRDGRHNFSRLFLFMAALVTGIAAVVAISSLNYSLQDELDRNAKELLGADVKLRFRPHYFSYTEPSFEIDFTSPMVRKMGKEWLELAGCGMVHPQVFENVGYDPEIWSGWAFGFGIERIAMLRYEINDIRLFYENDVRFLRQF